MLFRIQIMIVLYILPATLLANEVVALSDPLVVCIESQTQEGKTKIGTGFFIREDLVATVYHQVKNAESTIFRQDGYKSKAVIVDVDIQWDLAILKLPASDTAFFSLAIDHNPKLGQQAFTIGCPHGMEHTLAKGFISHSDRMMKGKKLLQIDMSINPGNSGGPLLDMDGDVVGIIWGKLLKSSNINFAIPVKNLVNLLEKNGITMKSLNKKHVEELWQLAKTASTVDEAVFFYQKIIKIQPDIAASHYNLGRLYYKNNEMEKAFQSFKQAIYFQENYYQAYTNLCLTHHKRNDFIAALNACKQAVAINPEYAPTYYNLGKVYEEGLNKPDMAKEVMSKYKELVDPEIKNNLQKQPVKVKQSLPTQQKVKINYAGIGIVLFVFMLVIILWIALRRMK